ncbi:MAG: ABC transporter substrate-binding protein [Chloroflexota bacterium]
MKVPDLHGQSINMFVGGHAPTAEDTNAYLVSRILRQWGAKVNYGTGGAANLGAAAVIANRDDMVRGPIPVMVKSKLTIFAPGQPHLSDMLVGRDGVKRVQDLAGHTFALQGPETINMVELSAIATKYGIPLSKIKLINGLSTPQNINAVLAGRADSTITDISRLSTIESQGVHEILSVADTVPTLADSVFAAKSSWLSSHPLLAEAVDLAWIEAAKISQRDEARWVAAAVAYTKGTVSKSKAEQAFSLYRKAGIYSYTQATFAPKEVSSNLQTLVTTKVLSAKPNVSQVANFQYWNKAWADLQSGKYSLPS